MKNPPPHPMRRMDRNAQWEIRQYANAVGELVASSFPRTWELFVEGRGS